MKNIAVGSTFLVLMAGAMLIGGYSDNTYDMQCRVSHTSGTEVVVEDAGGQLWAFEEEHLGDYRANDTVKVVFNMNGTEHNRYDDEIIKVKKVSK